MTEPQRYVVCAGTVKTFAVLDRHVWVRVFETNSKDAAVEMMDLLEDEYDYSKQFADQEVAELLVPSTRKGQNRELEAMFAMEDARDVHKAETTAVQSQTPNPVCQRFEGPARDLLPRLSSVLAIPSDTDTDDGSVQTH